MDGIHCLDFIFYNNFDSANLLKVEYAPQDDNSLDYIEHSSKGLSKSECIDFEFNIWTKPDCWGTEFQNGNRSWFSFGIKAPYPCLLVKLNLVDLNRQSKIYSGGMTPVYRIVPGKSKWERIHDKPVYFINQDIFTLSFKYRTPENQENSTFFAFTYPFSYTDLQKMLVNIDQKYLSINQTVSKEDADIYYVHETVCYSLEGRKIDLLTITSFHGITSEREDRLQHLFPEANVPRPYKFIGKKIIFISARVHPGETPSSFVFNGLLNLLLNRDNLQAQQLRKLYVFKLIPFLNPDGVAKGHYRTDSKGVNLNRVYLNPDLLNHPSIYAARALIRYYHYGMVEKEDNIPKCDNCLDKVVSRFRMSNMSLNNKESDTTDVDPWMRCPQCNRANMNLLKLNNMMLDEEQNICNETDKQNDGTTTIIERQTTNANISDSEDASGLFLYVDLHGHSSKKGVFMFGNYFPDIERRVECMLLPKLMALNNHNFHFQSCNFSEKNMYLRDKRDGMSRAGSGRVGVLSISGIVKSYTLECNYNTGRLVNALPPTIKEPTGKYTTISSVPPKYNPQIFEDVGKSLGASILDLTGHNPFTRLPNSEFHNLSGVKDWLRLNRACLGTGKVKCCGCGSNSHVQMSHTSQCVKQSPTSKSRPQLKNGKKINKSKSHTAQVERKENVATYQQHAPTASSQSKSVFKINKNVFKTKLRKEHSTSIKNKNVTNVGTNTEKFGVNRRVKKKPLPLHVATKKFKADEVNATKLQNTKDADAVHLREIYFIKNAECKTMMATYQNSSSKLEGETYNENLVLSWDDASLSKPTAVFTTTSKTKIPVVNSTAGTTSNAIHHFNSTNYNTNNKSISEPGTSKQYRVHNFARTNSLSRKTKIIKKNQILRRLSSATELGKIEKAKKKKIRMK